MEPGLCRRVRARPRRRARRVYRKGRRRIVRRRSQSSAATADDRKRRADDDRGEGQSRERGRGGRVDHPASDADDRGEDERDDGRAEALNGAVDHRDVPVLDVHRAHDAEHDERRQHEEAARGDSAADAVERIADVRRELLRLGAGKRHAEVERVQEPALADPPPPLDQLGMHDRDLAGRPAEADHAELEPEAECLTLRWPHDLGAGGRQQASAAGPGSPRAARARRDPTAARSDRRRGCRSG